MIHLGKYGFDDWDLRNENTWYLLKKTTDKSQEITYRPAPPPRSYKPSRLNTSAGSITRDSISLQSSPSTELLSEIGWFAVIVS